MKRVDKPEQRGLITQRGIFNERTSLKYALSRREIGKIQTFSVLNYYQGLGILYLVLLKGPLNIPFLFVP